MATMANLQGLHLLVTRPLEQALPWAEQLKMLGAVVSCQPMLSIEALEDQTSKQLIKSQIMKLDEYQKAIFVSQNAVNHGIEWLDQYWPQLPINLRILAIGSTTAALLEEKLSQLDANVLSPGQAMNSEALLCLPELNSVEGEKILIFRGKGGRTYLGDSLTEKGALVDYCELYQRSIPATIDTEVLSALKQSNLQPVLITHSGETLSNFCKAVDSHIDTDSLLWFKQQALLVPGKRVAEQAHNLKFEHIIIAENATHESMIGALHDWRQNNN
jgi:uroporphyrinogen-III synthase